MSNARCESPTDRSITLPADESLSLEECYAKLESEAVGRIVYSDGALPAITPVRYRVDGRDIYFRPGPDPRLTKAISQAVVAFEADQLNRETGSGWTVVVTGIATACTTPHHLARAAALHLLSSAETDRRAFVLSPGILSGQLVHP